MSRPASADSAAFRRAGVFSARGIDAPRPGYARTRYESNVQSSESGSSNSTRSLALSADIVTNNPNINPMPDRPLNGFACRSKSAVSAQVTAKIAQIAALNFTIVVRVLFALFVFPSVISCSIRISPFHFLFHPEASAPGEILISYRDFKLKNWFWEESGLCNWLMIL